MSKKLEIFGWGIYDLANTAFSALFITLFFPVLIKNYLGGNEFHIGLVMGVSIFLAGILVPFIGATSDKTGRRMPYIMFFTMMTIAFTVLVAFSNLILALVFAMLANFCYHAALDVYDAKLFDLSTSKNIGRISGYGTALGYVGTILSLLMAYLLLSYYGWETQIGVQAVFIGTAAFFFLFSLLTFAWLKDKKVKKVKFVAKKAFSSLMETFKTIKKNKSMWYFMLASFIFVDGMNTAIIFLFLFGQDQIGITVQQFFPLFAVMALAAALGSLLFGWINDRIGPKKSLVIILAFWTAIITMLIINTNFVTYFIAGILGGTFLGATWTVTRPMLVNQAPKKKMAELFGFQGLTEKFGGVLGPVLFGFVVVKAGYQPALFVLITFFVVGFILMSFVKEK